MAGVRALDRHQETTALLGMTLFLASWAMLFAALFFSYGLVRLRAPAWPPADLPALPLALPAVATGLLALASLVLERARRAPRMDGAAPVGSIAIAALAGGFFLLVQLQVWQRLWEQGLRFSSGPYGSVVFGLTGFHALHVLVGLGGLAGLMVTARLGRLRPLALRLWTLYMHLVGVLWALMFVSLYLL
jgi:cytochrome c oxidase subunit III